MAEEGHGGPVELLALGRCDVQVVRGDGAKVVAQTKRFGLFAYLALARPHGPRQRDELLGLFWPELSERRARQALSQSLYFLATQLGPDAIRRDGKTRVGVGPEVTSDVGRFEDLLGEDRLAEAVATYGGDLLPGLHVMGCAEFERWLERERRRLRSRAVETAIELSTRRLARGEEDDAVRFAKWAFAQRPYDEDAAIRLFGLLSDLGRTGELRREFESYERRLRDDLQLQPAEFLRELIPVREEIPPTSDPPKTEDSPEAPAPDPVAAPVPASRWRLAASIAGVATVGLVAWLLLAARSVGVSSPERPSVIVIPFEAVTTDPEAIRVARIATDWVAREVAASGLANVVAPSAATVRRGSAGDDRAGALGDSARPLSDQRFGLVVSGHVGSDGGQIEIDVSIREHPSERILRVLPTERGVAPEAMGVVERSTDRVAAALATVLDERIGSWAEVSSQPPSIEAYRAFFDGLDWFAREEADSADHYFLEAARQDSQFTAPLIWAVRSRVWAHRIAEADSLAMTLRPERARLAPWDRAMLDYYVAYLRGTWEEAYQAALEVERIAPDPEWSQLVAASAQAANRPEAALDALVRIDRDAGWARDWPYRWRTWTIIHHMLGQYEEELAAAEPERAEHPIGVAFTEISAFSGLDRPGAVDSTISRLAESVRDPDARILILRRAVDELRAHGHAGAASPLAAQALEIADSLVAAGDSTPDRLHLRGDLLYLAGRWAEAHAVLSSVEKEDVAGTLLTSRGRAAGRIGLATEARQAAADLLTEDPLDKGHGAFRAATILAALGDEAEATNLLRRAVAGGFGFYPWLHTVWEFENLTDYEPFQELMRPRG